MPTILRRISSFSGRFQLSLFSTSGTSPTSNKRYANATQRRLASAISSIDFLKQFICQDNKYQQHIIFCAIKLLCENEALPCQHSFLEPNHQNQAKMCRMPGLIQQPLSNGYKPQHLAVVSRQSNITVIQEIVCRSTTIYYSDADTKNKT